MSGPTTDAAQAVRAGPLAGSLWVRRADRAGVSVVAPAVTPGLCPMVCYRDAGGVTWVVTLADFQSRFEPWGGGGR